MTAFPRSIATWLVNTQQAGVTGRGPSVRELRIARVSEVSEKQQKTKTIFSIRTRFFIFRGVSNTPTTVTRSLNVSIGKHRYSTEDYFCKRLEFSNSFFSNFSDTAVTIIRPYEWAKLKNQKGLYVRFYYFFLHKSTEKIPSEWQKYDRWPKPHWRLQCHIGQKIVFWSVVASRMIFGKIHAWKKYCWYWNTIGRSGCLSSIEDRRIYYVLNMVNLDLWDPHFKRWDYKKGISRAVNAPQSFTYSEPQSDSRARLILARKTTTF